MKRYILPVTALLTIAFSACKKDKDYLHALVIDTGDIARGGCGYILAFDDGKKQMPAYLNSAYQHDSLSVLVKIHYGSGSTVCTTDSTNEYLQTIIVDDIKRDL